MDTAQLLPIYPYMIQDPPYFFLLFVFFIMKLFLMNCVPGLWPYEVILNELYPYAGIFTAILIVT